MTDKTNFELELRDFIASRRRIPFDWARNNCGFFCADWILRITGVDPAAPWRGSINNQADADAVIENHGGMRGLAESLMGKAIQPLQARPGDIVLAPIAEGTSEGLGICVGPYAAFVGDETLTRINMRDALCAWRVE